MGFLYCLLLEQAKFYPNFSLDVPLAQKHIKVLFLALILALSLLTIFRRSTTIALNAACFGFIAMGLSSAVYVLFQIFYGSLFWKHGILVGLFMAGISLSVFLSSLLSEKIQPSFKKLTGLHCLWILFISFFLFTLTKFPDVFQNELILYFLSFVVGSFTGLGYPLLTRLLLEKNKKNQETSVAIYAADLAGAFIGSIGFSIFFIPFLGIAQSFILLITLGMIFGLKNVFR
jgi:predicted membrane-bound spermidine synthase